MTGLRSYFSNLASDVVLEANFLQYSVVGAKGASKTLEKILSVLDVERSFSVNKLGDGRTLLEIESDGPMSGRVRLAVFLTYALDLRTKTISLAARDYRGMISLSLEFADGAPSPDRRVGDNVPKEEEKPK